MRIRIPEPTTWRADGKIFAFGEYRVPDDMSEQHAKRALDEGAAELVAETKPAPKGKATKTEPARAG